MSNDQHQEYVDAATRAAFTGEAGHETRGPGAAIRARIGAQALRDFASNQDDIADAALGDLPVRFAARYAATCARNIADRLENNTKEN